MSACEVYLIEASGDVVLHAELRNAHAGASAVWEVVAVQVGLIRDGASFATMRMNDAAMEQLWRAVDDVRLSLAERVVLALTFDRVYVAAEHLPHVSAACRQWGARHGGKSHVPAWGLLAEELVTTEGVRGLCFNQTSVTSSYWWLDDEGNDGEDAGRPYNVDRDEGHWELFAEYPDLLAVLTEADVHGG